MTEHNPFSPNHNPGRPATPAPAWPGQPLSTTDLQRLYPTTDHPAPFRPHKPWTLPKPSPNLHTLTQHLTTAQEEA